MRIKEIEIDNFKSFGKPTKIPFLAGFTAISGPNGSGKSNIIDSVLFCLGLSNSRTMRAEKLTDLININNNRREAKVTIRFGGETEAETIEVARRLRESDNGYQSTYYLNGKACTLTELHDTLAMHNVSPNGYNVVMQGDVTRIVTMTPTERRKIIDEIAGVAEFDSRVNLATKELDKVNEQEDKSALILGEIAERLVQLQSERDHALKYQTIRTERDRLEALTKLSVAWDMRQKIAGLLDVVSAADERQGTIQATIDEAKAVVAARQAEYAELSSAIQQKGEDELLSLQAQLEETKGQIEREKSGREYLEQQKFEADRLERRDLESIERHRAKLEDLAHRQTEAGERKTRHQQDLSGAQKTWQEAHEELSSLYATNEDTAKKGTELRRELNEVKDKYNELWREKVRIEDASHRSGDKLETWKNELATHREAIKGLDKEAIDLQAEVNDYQESIQDYEKERAHIAERYAQAQASVEELSRGTDKARDAYFRADATFKAAGEGSFGRAVEAVLSAGLKGVHGTLAQLGEVDPQYTQALEIAAGAKLRNVVVDDDSVASRGIEILKSNRAGRATFLPLNKLNPPRRLMPTGEPGFIGYAVNLVKFDARYAAAFHFAFGETLVVRDMASARPHIGRYRMVTLEGDLLERSGAMTGGSDGKGSGLRFTASLAKDLEEAKRAFDSAVSKLTHQKAVMEAIAQDAEKAKEQQRHWQDQIRGKQFELQDRTRRLQALKDQILALESQITIEESESEGIEERLEKLQEQLFVFEDRQNQLELEISDIDELLDNERVAELSSLVNSHDFNVKRLEGLINNCEHELKGIQLESESSTEAIAQIQIEVDRRKEEFVTIAQKVANSEETLKACLDKLSALERQRDALRDRIGSLQLERERKAEEVRVAERKVSDRERELERLLEGVSATREQIASLQPQLQAMEDDLWLNGIEPPKEQPAEQSTEELKRQIVRLEGRMRDMEPVNMLAIESFDREAARQADLQEKVSKLREERLTILERIDEIAAQKKASFMKAYDQMAVNFAEIFAELAAGTGHLHLENPEDPFDGGLIIRAQPKDKKMQRLEAMSGGEKSLTALAFLFSFQRYMPAPFYAFDEVDAALDGVNAERLAVMIQKQTTHAQCIVISHRRPMLERSDQTIGISARTDGATRVLGVKWS
ncbi:MAG TPA: chromosome segregation protein SMC [Pantanalinema sp.]